MNVLLDLLDSDGNEDITGGGHQVMTDNTHTHSEVHEERLEELCFSTTGHVTLMCF